MRLGRTATTIHRRDIARQGVTLLEVLVVISIMLILLAVAVPRLRPMMEQRRIREASRTVSGFFYAARSRAMETGRPVGVAIERLKSQPEAAVTLRMVEVPPPYCGDTTAAKARVRKRADGYFEVQFTGDVSLLVQLVKVGDLITFESQSVRYRIGSLGPNSLIARLLDLTDTPWPVQQDPNEPPKWSHPVSFQIHRRPEPSSAMPVRLPPGTVIDLVASGSDSWFLEYDQERRSPPPPNGLKWAVPGFVPFVRENNFDPSPVIVLFRPDGGVDKVYRHRYQVFWNPAEETWQAQPVYEGISVTEPIYFLIGAWDRMPAQGTLAEPLKANDPTRDSSPTYVWPSTAEPPPEPPKRRQPSLADDGLYNWQDLTNFWLVVNPSTGLAVTAPVAAPEGGFAVVGGAKVPSNLFTARYDARQMKAVGGR